MANAKAAPEKEVQTKAPSKEHKEIVYKDIGFQEQETRKPRKQPFALSKASSPMLSQSSFGTPLTTLGSTILNEMEEDIVQNRPSSQRQESSQPRKPPSIVPGTSVDKATTEKKRKLVRGSRNPTDELQPKQSKDINIYSLPSSKKKSQKFAVITGPPKLTAKQAKEAAKTLIEETRESGMPVAPPRTTARVRQQRKV